MKIQLEKCKSMITASKSLVQYVSENTKGGWKKIPSMYNKMLFTMNSEDIETTANKISTQGIEIINTNTDTKSHSLLEITLKHQGLYYTFLQIANVKQIVRGAWLWTS